MGTNHDHSTRTVGEFVRLNKGYEWANGKHAGQVVRITTVQDDREATNEESALIYVAEYVNGHGETMATGIPVLPSDIDETYDHYEAQQAADFNRFLGYVTA